MEKHTILAVDDNPVNLQIIDKLLSTVYQVRVARSGRKALELINNNIDPDLILLDVMMPELDGYEVCKFLKDDAKFKEIPVIFLTALTDSKDEEYGFDVGGVDFIRKPINPATLLARINNHIKIDKKNKALANRVKDNELQLDIIRDITLNSLLNLAKYRDNETGQHIIRTQNYVKVLATKMREYPSYDGQLSAREIELMYKSSPLHDIGKVAVPDSILKKPGSLSSEEFEIMKKHAEYGFEVLSNAEKNSGINEEKSFLRVAKEIAYYHHEKWDGSGYPCKLKNQEIPISARFMAVADVYDALINKRVYKPAMPHQKAVEIIKKGKGTQFAPDVIDAFVSIQDEFNDIAKDYPEEQ
jgi:putative two-component system response regulator